MGLLDAKALSDNEKSVSPHARKGKRGFSGDLYKTDEFLKLIHSERFRGFCR